MTYLGFAMTSKRRPYRRQLHVLRQWYGLTQEDVAVGVGICLKTYRNAERDGSVSDDTKRRIGAFFGEPPERFIWS